MFTQIGRQEFRLLSPEIVSALKEVGDKFGLDFSINGARGGGSQVRINLETKLRKLANGKTPSQTEFEACAHYYGLKPEHFGKTFAFQGKLYRISGIKTGAPKYPILADRLGGIAATFKFQPRSVLAGLPKEVAAAA